MLFFAFAAVRTTLGRVPLSELLATDASLVCQWGRKGGGGAGLTRHDLPAGTVCLVLSLLDWNAPLAFVFPFGYDLWLAFGRTGLSNLFDPVHELPSSSTSLTIHVLQTKHKQQFRSSPTIVLCVLGC